MSAGLRQLFALERRIQDIEVGNRNHGRQGKVTEVKFDKEKKSWYARMEQGDGDEKFETDWLPWKSFSHGTIKSSIPPRKGQLVSLNSPQGQAEQGHLAPAHYDPENESPHDKEDEAFFRIHKPKGDKDKEGKNEDGSDMTDEQKKEKAEKDAEEDFKMKFTKDGLEFSIGKSKLTMGAKGFKLIHDKHELNLSPDGWKESIDDGKAVVELTKDKIKSKIGDTSQVEMTKAAITSTSETVKAKSKDGSGSITVDDSGVDTQGKKINDG